MALREVRDDRGELWRVWDVAPERRDRRRGGERRRNPRETQERRRIQLLSAAVRGEFRTGWLVFESTAEKRRLCPVPPDWLGLSDRTLLDLLSRAAPVMKARWPDA